jgi:hypothetical protein
MGILGFAASFMPQEILTRLGTVPNASSTVLLQVTGALYLGFAILNWMARNVIIGGIYARPVALGNFLHFAVVTAAAGKVIAAGAVASRILLAASCFYAVFAVWFGLVLFTHPGERQ